jgi:hypothetical protein
MNSVLQILFFIRPFRCILFYFRKKIIEENNDKKIFKALKQIFIELMDIDEESRAVDAEDLILAYEKFADYPRAQQDIHEFMIGFMDGN